MYSHQPDNYHCPFCDLIAGKESELNRSRDIVFRNEYVTAAVAPKWAVNNPGHVLVMPNAHYENIYDIPDDLISEVYKAVKKLSITMRRAYKCDGISNRQHNEPAGDQDVWHFHVHVIPRYDDDKLYKMHGDTYSPTADETAAYAERLRTALACTA